MSTYTRVIILKGWNSNLLGRTRSNPWLQKLIPKWINDHKSSIDLGAVLSVTAMKLMTWVQVLVEAVCVSLCAKAFGKRINPFVLSSAIDKL